MSGAQSEEVLPGGLQRPVSLFITGPSGPLLKWAALGLLAPYSERMYWTEVRAAGSSAEPDDPIAHGAIPPDRLHVVHPTELRREEHAGRQAEAAARTVLRPDEYPESIRRISEFLRLSSHSQELIAATTGGRHVPILVASNAQFLDQIFPSASILPTVQAFLNSGACLVLVWTGPAGPAHKVFDVLLQVEGPRPSLWREATVRSEKGISSGPLADGRPHRLGELPTVARFLDEWMAAEKNP